MNNTNNLSYTLNDTHQVFNQPKNLENYNLYLVDTALQEAVLREGGASLENHLKTFGEIAGRSTSIEHGFLANEHKPQFFSHNRQGERIDEIRFHPSYHQLMSTSMEYGLHSRHWQNPQCGAHVTRAALFYMQTQVEAAHLCPITMTSAAIPALSSSPEILEEYGGKILSNEYDPRNIPLEQKQSITVGMAMTEKQGGSDVQANTTVATPVKAFNKNNEYQLVGHKYFVSAPMCDAFLILAHTDNGLSCFFVPRWKPDGTKNPIQIQRLKLKMGNVANASCETELRGAYGLLVGKEGKGVSTILTMVAMTRFDCMVGSAAGMRQAVVQVVHHCQQRKTFGKFLVQQPLMQNVLADLIIESESALALTMRIAKALDSKEDSRHEAMLVRIGTSIGKYWICKRQPEHAFEAMECIGGMGVMEDTIMPRLYREAPINSIWEGSGNVQCLDMLRSITKIPECLQALFTEIEKSAGRHDNLDIAIEKLKQDLAEKSELEYRARRIVQTMALTLQASILFSSDNLLVAKAFCDTRLAKDNMGLVYGNLPTSIDCKAIIERVFKINDK